MAECAAGRPSQYQDGDPPLERKISNWPYIPRAAPRIVHLFRALVGNSPAHCIYSCGATTVLNSDRSAPQWILGEKEATVALLIRNTSAIQSSSRRRILCIEGVRHACDVVLQPTSNFGTSIFRIGLIIIIIAAALARLATRFDSRQAAALELRARARECGWLKYTSIVSRILGSLVSRGAAHAHTLAMRIWVTT